MILGELGGYLAPPWVHKSGEVEIVDFSKVLYGFLSMRFVCRSLILCHVGALSGLSWGDFGDTWGHFGVILRHVGQS